MIVSTFCIICGKKSKYEMQHGLRQFCSQKCCARAYRLRIKKCDEIDASVARRYASRVKVWHKRESAEVKT